MRSMDRVCALLVCALGAGCFDAAPPPVVLTAISPPLASIAGGTTVQLYGSGYVPGTQVRFGSLAAAVQVDSAEQLSVVVPRWPAEQGLVNVIVQRPDGPSVSRDDLFSYYALSGTPQSHLNPAAPVRAVATADWNRDGRADLAVAISNSTTVTLLLSQPDGSLLAAHRYDAGTEPAALAVADGNAN